MELAQSELLVNASLSVALGLIARTAAAALEVKRVSIWRYEPTPPAIRCLASHDPEHPDQSAGAVLAGRDYPRYFAALTAAKIIAANDARQDERTREFAHGYLDVLGITSMLDAPIQIGGKLRGVICVEQVGPAREWHADEETFVLSIAALVALGVERHERQQIEAALARSETDFRLLFAQSPLPMWVFELKTLQFLAVNDAAVRHYGYSREEFLGMTIAEIRPPEDVPALRASQPGSETELYSAGVWRHRKKSGEILFVQITARPITFQGRAAELILAQDITASRVAELALRESEARFRQMAEAIPGVFWLTDINSPQMLYVSPAYATIWGRSVESLLEEPDSWLAAVHEDDRPRVSDASAAMLERGTYDEEYRIVRPDGSERWVRDQGFPIRDGAGRVVRFAGVATDITEHKDLERQFLRAQRLESVGTLASGVAHDLNNILSPVLMGAALLKRAPLDPENARLLDLIEQSARRGAGVVNQLLTFSRGAGGERIPLQPRHVLKEILQLMQETFPRNLVIDLYAPRELWLVPADATQLHQVLMNLCVNARDAMPQGGQLSLSAANMTLPNSAVRGAPPSATGPHVRIAVRDTGEGIPPALLDRIFDPFFSTKAPGKGTGLGLSTVLGIVRAHGGFVHVESTPGAGSEFQIFLPALMDERENAPAVESPAPAGRGELVLIVDDEEPVRATLDAAFGRQGYHVLLAANGEDALRAFVAHRAAVKLVVVDYMMPGINGVELAEALRRLAPAVMVILLTGLAETVPAGGGIARVLAKPCAPDELLAAARDVLQGTIESAPIAAAKPADQA